MTVVTTKRDEAVAFLRATLPQEDKVKIRDLIAKHGSREWVHHLFDDEIAKLTEDQKRMNMAAFWVGRGHFSFGMEVRNRLSDAGFTAKALSVSHLDDIYIDLINEAVIA